MRAIHRSRRARRTVMGLPLAEAGLVLAVIAVISAALALFATAALGVDAPSPHEISAPSGITETPLAFEDSGGHAKTLHGERPTR